MSVWPDKTFSKKSITIHLTERGGEFNRRLHRFQDSGKPTPEFFLRPEMRFSGLT
jgi:hypothetical protein